MSPEGDIPAVLAVPSRPDEHQRTCLRIAQKALRRVDQQPPPTIRSTRVPVRGNGWGRYAELIDPSDAIALYRRLHNEPILVLAFDELVGAHRPDA